MNYTQEQVDWYHSVVNSGQMTHDQAVNALNAHIEAQAAPVEQPAQVVQGQPTQVAQGVSQAVDNTAELANIAMLAAEDEDHGAILSGKPPRAGIAWLRILNYIEIGVHQGKNTTYSPKPVAILTVELHHPDHLVEQDGVLVPKTLDIRISKTHSNNSKFPKFFKSLARALGNHPATGRPITHLSQAIGMCCLGDIVHNKDNDKVYANLDQDGAWSFKSATYQDPASGQMVTVTIPPLHGEPKLFLMDNQKVLANPQACKAMWDSIYEGGVRKYKDAQGQDKESSNNYHQELIAKSLEWQTSPMKRVLDSLGCTTTFGDTPVQQAAPAQTVVPQQANYAPQQPAPTQPAQAAPVSQPTPMQANDVPFDVPAQSAPQSAPQQAPAQQLAQPVSLSVPQAQPVQAVQQQAVQAPAGQMSAEAFMSQFQ